MFVGGMSAFMTVFPLSAWMYVGVEAINLAASIVVEPRLSIPRGSIATIITLMTCGIFVLCVVASLPPPGITCLENATYNPPLYPS